MFTRRKKATGRGMRDWREGGSMGLMRIQDGGMSLVGVMESWDWHGYKVEVLFWRGPSVPEISIDPQQSMLRPSYFTWNRNIHPLLYVCLAPDEPSCGMVVTQNDRVKSILSEFWNIMVNFYAEIVPPF